MGKTKVTGKWTTSKLQSLKGRERIAALTAYDFSTARMIDEAGLQVILVGDSLGMTVLGFDSTLPVTLEHILHHSRAVSRGVKHAMVVADMPFLTYQASIEQAIDNAGRLLKEGTADSVKIEGGAFRAPTVKALVQNGIPVMGHIGLTPQSVKAFGGYKVQGREAKEAQQLREDALALEQAGAFAIVLECMPADLSREITQSLRIPTIGIGAGPGCDGQILVVNDMLGLFTDFLPKFVKKYASLGEDMKRAFARYVKDIDEGVFPGPDHWY